jgi:hypothetical protein
MKTELAPKLDGPTDIQRLLLVERKLESRQTALGKTIRTALEEAIEIGRLLAEAKSLVRHGDWLTWLGEHFLGSVRSADRYMQLAAHVAQIPDDVWANSPSVASLSITAALDLMSMPKPIEPAEVIPPPADGYGAPCPDQHEEPIAIGHEEAAEEDPIDGAPEPADDLGLGLEPGDAELGPDEYEPLATPAEPNHAAELERVIRDWIKRTPGVGTAIVACFLESIAAKLRA